MPCTMQENVSSRLADFLGSRPNLPVMSRAMSPVVRMAIVLLAVQRFDSPTRPAMLNSAPRLPLMPFVRPRMMKSRPPLCLISSSIPPESIVTMISSPIPPIPSPTLPRNPSHVIPSRNPITALRTRPMPSTTSTFIPHSASTMTVR